MIYILHSSLMGIVLVTDNSSYVESECARLNKSFNESKSNEYFWISNHTLVPQPSVKM